MSVSSVHSAARALLRRGALAGSSRTCRVLSVISRSPGRVNASRSRARPLLTAGVVRADQPGQGGLGVVGAHPDRVGQQIAFSLQQAAAGTDLTQG